MSLPVTITVSGSPATGKGIVLNEIYKHLKLLGYIVKRLPATYKHHSMTAIDPTL